MTIDPARLPQPEKSVLTVGYIRLTDSAPLVIAKELSLFERYGLDVTLQCEPSWANLRDKVVVGVLDAASLLAPLPLATAMGVGGIRADMVTGLVLSLNGNGITMANHLARELAPYGSNPTVSAATSAQALQAWLQQRKSDSALTLASTHTFSCHTFQLHAWLRRADLDPERDVKIIVLPPEQMVDSLARGSIDGFCVGEPWNTVAVQQGVGSVLATGYQIANNAIEKVLGVTQKWHNDHPATHLRLRLALMQACQWLAEHHNRMAAADILARPEYLNLPERQLLPSLSGRFQFIKGSAPVDMPHFHVFGRFQAGFPWRSSAEHLLQQCNALLGRDSDRDQLKGLVQQTFRTDLYREAARNLNMAFPESDYAPPGPHDSIWRLRSGLEMGPDRKL
ncbi:MAG: ABC transporter substrate-binding protein [Halioglobus sp.]|nr:ABC transporter substrate-binding protein [Halioglobus sp.]